MATFIAFEKSLVNGMLVGVENGRRKIVDPRTVVRDLMLMDRGGARQAQTSFDERTGVWTIRVGGSGRFMRGYQIFAALLTRIEKGIEAEGVKPVVDDRRMVRFTKPASKAEQMKALAQQLGHAVRVDREGNPILSDEDKAKLAPVVEKADEEQPTVVAPKRRGRPSKAAKAALAIAQ